MPFGITISAVYNYFFKTHHMQHLYKKACLALLIAGTIQASKAQKRSLKDTITLDSVQIRESRIKKLPDVTGTNIFAGKRTFSITPTDGRANLATNNARMIFAQVPGVNVWEMDGAGLQLNIGTRGTDTHRSIETNMRQNGYNTNSDMFGYPEDHYTPPMQAVGEIQIVRGSAALQFGSQFGGMVNLKMKEPDSTKQFGIESEQTAGSNKFFNSYNAISGTSGKVSYYAYYSNRSGDGWRPNAAFNYQAFYAHLKYQFNPQGSLIFEFSRMNYRQQIAGGLTDVQFNADNRLSTRSRNFFNPEINIPALIFNYNFSPNTKLEVTSHLLWGQRNSVQFIANANVPDTINTKTNSYNPRQVDRDYYTGFTTEARLLHSYQLGNLKSTFTAGLRYFTETTTRDQKGTGTTASDFDLSLIKPYGIDLHLHTDNYAVFAENMFNITSKFSVTPGFRYESIKTDMSGVILNATFPVNYQSNRNFPLFGTGLQYQLTKSSQFYGNISQAYRPYIYANVTPADQLGVINPNLKDSKGYSADLGYRGHVGYILNYDLDFFYVYYGNRVGNLTETNASNQTYLYTTNIGNAVAKGIEAYGEVSLLRSLNHSSPSDLRLFNSFSYDHARYTSGSITQGTSNISLIGNYAEGTPEWIDRAGLTYLDKHVTGTLQYSYVGKNYSDANNTKFNPTGASGLVPAYHVFDASFNYSFLSRYHIMANMNNILNAKYFTRRINMYPGPGILPADGRTFNIGFGVKL
jgi:Fe(3+) dicitrate transport protein